MRIMPAGMHYAHLLSIVFRCGFGTKGQVVALRYRQSVNISAQRDHLSRLTAFQHTHNTCTGRCAGCNPHFIQQ